MFAEITVAVAEPFPHDLQAHARAWFEPIAPAQAAAGLKRFSGEPDLAASALVVNMSATHAVLLFREDLVSLTAHVELIAGRPTLRHLKTVAERTARRLATFLRAHGRPVQSLHISIFSEGELLEIGRRHSWPYRLITAARKETAGRLSVPLATFLASLFLDSDMRRATVSALGAVVGLIIWLLLSVTLDRSEYRYE